MSNGKQKYNVLAWIRGESLDELEIFDDRIDEALAELDTVEFAPLDPEDPDARRALTAWLYADRAPTKDELPEDQTTIPPGTTIHFARWP